MPTLPAGPFAMLDANQRAPSPPRISREGPGEPPKGLQASGFEARGSTAAVDAGRDVYVRLAGRDGVKYRRNGRELDERAQVFERSSDGASVVAFDVEETWEGFEQIAADLRDAFFAMGFDEVRFASPAGHDRYVTYRWL